MLEGWMSELIVAIGKLFINPLLYWGILLVLFSSWKRIKKERAGFGQKIFDKFAELKDTWRLSLLSGLIFSVCAIGLGMVISYSLVIILSTVMIVLSLNAKFTYLSAAYTFGITFLSVLLLPMLLAGNFPPIWVTAVADTDFSGFLLLMGLFLIVEAMLLLRLNSNQSFPELIKGKRGKWIGRHRIQKMAFVPVFTLVPGGLIEPFADWWPMLDITGNSYGLILLPLITGFEHTTTAQHPVQAAKKIGRSVFLLGLLVLGLAIGSDFWRPLTVVTIAVALAGRELISYRHRAIEKKQPSYFQEQDDGLLILGIIPGSPADRLGLKVGEKIEKANGERVTNEKDFYKALQRNSAFCKLEVRDENNELRFTQRAMYQGEHHKLGVLFTGKQEHQIYLEESAKLDS